ncbi:MAG: hypothetical protein LBS21_11865 [Clostridiales bacterium]|jgi:hypothetical protein|nr:hypothetical protein [Clostridiales bacterium]
MSRKLCELILLLSEWDKITRIISMRLGAWRFGYGFGVSVEVDRGKEMTIADNIIRNRLANVYFIWGRGKTTIANELSRKYALHIYDVDKNRNLHLKDASPLYQPYMCRDYEKEYGVSDFWELPAEVIHEREKNWLREFTPMAILDLLVLSTMHKGIICEGDIDHEMVIPVASHSVYLCNRSTKFDWFNRPDHIIMLDIIKNRTDLTEKEKEAVADNAYSAVANSEGKIPDWVFAHNIKTIIWNDGTSISQTAAEAAEYFQLPLMV